MSPATVTTRKGSFTDLRIQFLDKDGTPGTAITDTFPVGLTVVTLHSENGQKLTGMVAGGGLTLKLDSTVAGVQPLVHGKQNGVQRRYVVSNAGAIRKRSEEGQQRRNNDLRHDRQYDPKQRACTR